MTLIVSRYLWKCGLDSVDSRHLKISVVVLELPNVTKVGHRLVADGLEQAVVGSLQLVWRQRVNAGNSFSSVQALNNVDLSKGEVRWPVVECSIAQPVHAVVKHPQIQL